MINVTEFEFMNRMFMISISCSKLFVTVHEQVFLIFFPMDLRRERKRSLKVREQQEAEFERMEATKKRYAP